MSPIMKCLGLDRLSPGERLALAQEIWDSVSAGDDVLPLSEEQKQTFARRSEKLAAGPRIGLTWAEIRRSIEG